MSAPRNHKISGFTMLELLISISIMGVVVAIVVQAFWLSFNSWRRGSDTIESALNMRVVVNLMSKQLRSFFPYYEEEGAEKTLLFDGQSDSMRFVTSYPLGMDKTGGLFEVYYYVDSHQTDGGAVLKIAQQPVYDKKRSTTELKEKGLTLLSDIKDVTWSYMNAGGWSQEWDSERQNQPPEKIRIDIAYLDAAATKNQRSVVSLFARPPLADAAGQSGAKEQTDPPKDTNESSESGEANAP